MRITNHGYQRINERVGLSKDAAEKMASKALERGIKHSDTTGSLNKYLSFLFFHNKTANNCRIYGEHVYLFKGTILITVLHLENKYKQAVQKISKRLKE